MPKLYWMAQESVPHVLPSASPVPMQHIVLLVHLAIIGKWALSQEYVYKCALLTVLSWNKQAVSHAKMRTALHATPTISVISVGTHLYYIRGFA